MNRAGVDDVIEDTAREVGIQVWVHARRLGDDPEVVDTKGSEPVPMASLYKLPLAACWSDLVASGTLEPRQRLRMTPDDRAPGPTGIAVLADDVSVSQRDAVRLMLSVSDNAAAERILAIVGLDRLAQWLVARNLTHTAVRRGSRESWGRVTAETGGGHAGEAPARLANTDVDVQTSEYDTLLASVSTAADLTSVLDSLWAGGTTAGSGSPCACRPGVTGSAPASHTTTSASTPRPGHWVGSGTRRQSSSSRTSTASRWRCSPSRRAPRHTSRASTRPSDGSPAWRSPRCVVRRRPSTEDDPPGGRKSPHRGDPDPGPPGSSGLGWSRDERCRRPGRG